MSHPKFYKELVGSDEFAQCSLRSTFFERRLRELRLVEAIEEIEKLTHVRASFNWDNCDQFGIDKEAWDRLTKIGIGPLKVFLHPRVLKEQPKLLLYYRTVALISQKALIDIVGGNIANVEQGKTERLEANWARRIVFTINAIMSGVIKTAAEIDIDDLPRYQFATLGTQIQGGWNNNIGTQGEIAVKTLLLNHLRKEIAQIVWRGDRTADYVAEKHAEFLEQIRRIKVVRLSKGFHLMFSSEPDISLRNKDDIPVLAIEVKAGHDTRGALERLGAGMKSFENDRNLNPRVKTVYVVRAMTPELERRMRHSSPFNYIFGLAELLAGGKAQTTFGNLIVRTILAK